MCEAWEEKFTQLHRETLYLNMDSRGRLSLQVTTRPQKHPFMDSLRPAALAQIILCRAVPWRLRRIFLSAEKNFFGNFRFCSHRVVIGW